MMMKCCSVFLLLASLLLCVQVPAPAADEGKIIQKVQVDVDGDGKNELVALKAYKAGAYSYAQLILLDGRGSTRWAGPKVEKPDMSKDDSPLIFPRHDARFVKLETAGRMGGQGSVEVVFSDYNGGGVVRTAFRVLRWDGKGFVPVVDAKELPESPAGSGRFLWKKYSRSLDKHRFIDSFLAFRPDGTGLVRVASYPFGGEYREGQTAYMTGEAVVSRSEGGFSLIRWEDPLHPSAGIWSRSEFEALTEADLKGRNARELTLMRNEIYARHGYVFSDRNLIEYFKAQAWYRPDRSYSEAWLSQVETRNAQFIKDYQKKNRLEW